LIEKINHREESQDISPEGLKKSALREKLKFIEQLIQSFKEEEKEIPQKILDQKQAFEKKLEDLQS